jgi:hypothetical protein
MTDRTPEQTVQIILKSIAETRQRFVLPSRGGVKMQKAVPSKAQRVAKSAAAKKKRAAKS